MYTILKSHCCTPDEVPGKGKKGKKTYEGEDHHGIIEVERATDQSSSPEAKQQEDAAHHGEDGNTDKEADAAIRCVCHGCSCGIRGGGSGGELP